jgi:membrane protease YdiL (CAAX protease family)
MDLTCFQWTRERRNVILWGEFLLLFIGMPTLCYFHVLRLHPMAIIWIVSLFCATALLRDRKFDLSRFWKISGWKAHVPRAVLRFAAVATVLGSLAFYLGGSESYSHLQGHSPVFFTLFFYPILSVYPQGIIYRGFLFHRYQDLFPDHRLLILASALVFGYGHIIYDQPATVGLTMAGGLFFAWTYSRTGSLILAGAEHALYGDFIFAAGLWRYFFHHG